MKQEKIKKDVNNTFFIFGLLSGLSLFFTITFQYIGEEGVYTLTTMEMWQQNKWLMPLFYGEIYPRPPLFNWLMVPFLWAFGIDYILIIARIITVCATLGTGWVIAFLAKRLSKEKKLPLLAVLCFFSVDMLFKRGWLAYADGVFAFLTVFAISFLWLAVEKKQSAYFLLSVFAVSAAFLTKSYIAYAFYGAMGLTLILFHPNRKFLLSNYFAYLAHTLMIAFLLYWHFLTQYSQQAEMLADIVRGYLCETSLLGYLAGVFRYLLKFFVYFLPATALVAFILYQERDILAKIQKNSNIKILMIFLSISFLPFCFSPKNEIRYILPLYPFFALFFAYLLLKSDFYKEKILSLFSLIFPSILTLKLIFGVVGLHYYENHYRGAYLKTAQDILLQVGQAPLYTTETTYVGISLAAEINRLRWPKPTLTYPKQDHIKQFILAGDPNTPPGGRIIKVYQHGKKQIFLKLIETFH